ncbi:MAG: ATPase domain-containing protein [Desulfurococcaceae archaeon TW002]
MGKPGEFLGFGIEGLDKTLGGFILPPYTIVIAGHPGAGKTIMASTICYSNALKGYKCLYISMQEDKEKFYKYMSRLGIDLEKVESAGFFKFIKIPITLNIDEIAETISKLVTKEYDVVVVDSVNPILDILEKEGEKRSWLQNFFYTISRIINGLLILVAEIPYGSESLGLGSIEFVSDALLILKHKKEEGFIVRSLEIRKARGIPVLLAEIPISISEGKGIEVWVPSILDEIVEEGKQIELHCNLLRRTLNHIHKGMIINIVYPPDTDYHIDLVLILLGLSVKENMRILFMSYKYPSNMAQEALVNSLVSRGFDKEFSERLIKNHVIFKGVNPFSYSISQLAMRELSIINELNPDMVVFHSVEIPRHAVDVKDYIRELYNQMNYLKKLGKIVLRAGAYIDDLSYKLWSRIADIVIRLEYEVSGSNIGCKAYLWRRFKEPYIVTCKEICECLEEIVGYMKKLFMSVSEQ